MKNIGLYIHVPFCRSKCPYCDFYSVSGNNNLIDDYVLSVTEKMEYYSGILDVNCDTLYFGGGTPSLIGSDRIGIILNRAKSAFNVNGEITVECNPTGLTSGFFNSLADYGVNRVSIGLQSAVDSERKILGRVSGKEVVENRIRECRSAGINNISLDIMLGIPGQTLSSLDETVNFCLKQEVPHISAYMLKIEEGTFFCKNRNRYNFPDEDLTADMYEQLCRKLCEFGYHHYEISNFSLYGYEGKHNLKYWRCEDYLGIGPGAHSFINNERFYFPRDIHSFINGVGTVSDGEGGNLEEYIMLALRISDGLRFSVLENMFKCQISDNLMNKFKYFNKIGLLNLNDYRASLTEKGMLLSNKVIGDIIDCI